MAPFSRGTAISFLRKMFFFHSGSPHRYFFSNGKIPPSYLHLPTIMLRQSCLRSGLEGLSYQEVRQNIGNHVEGIGVFRSNKMLVAKKGRKPQRKTTYETFLIFVFLLVIVYSVPRSKLHQSFCCWVAIFRCHQKRRASSNFGTWIIGSQQFCHRFGIVYKRDAFEKGRCFRTKGLFNHQGGVAMKLHMFIYRRYIFQMDNEKTVV